MEDLLEKDCIVIANECGLLSLCSKYKIPCKFIHTSLLNGDLIQYTFIVSKYGVKRCADDVPPDLTVFKTLESLKFYLFNRALFNGKIVVHKEDYHIYLKTIKCLKKIGIKTIKDKTYFDEAYFFNVSRGCFKELSYIEFKIAVTMANGLSYKASIFLRDLKEFIKNKSNYKKYITYRQTKIGEE